MKIVVIFIILLCISPVALGHGMSEADQIRAAEGGFFDFFPLGAIHMLTGYDHLLFLFGVMFFLTKFKDVIKFVTAFTLGHSITLILATFLGIQANYFLIDAVIALTVCYKGFDNLNGFQKYLGMKSPNLLAAVFIFGLIHGFGLSTRLQQVTIGEGMDLLGKIIAFNIGVEAGQIAALIVILFTLSTWRRTDSFSRVSNASNTALVIVGGLLFMMQLHGYQHSVDPSAFPFDQDSHAHEHQNFDSTTQQLPEGWHIDPGETEPHTHDEPAAVSEGAHVHPGESEPHSHDEPAAVPEGAHVHPGETEPHSHDEPAAVPEGTHVHPGESEPHADHNDDSHTHGDGEAHEHHSEPEANQNSDFDNPQKPWVRKTSPGK